MRRYLLHDSFNIYEFAATTWKHPVHNHTYFEVILILKGRGTHQINDYAFQYNSGDVFILGPEDFHSFDIKSPTEFCYIRFNEQYARNNDLTRSRNGQKVVNHLLQLIGQSKEGLVIGRSEGKRIRPLVDQLRKESMAQQAPHHTILRDALMMGIFSLLARALRKAPSAMRQKSTSLDDLIHYIGTHLHDQTKLNMKWLANEFHYSENYLGILFKRHTGEPLKQYIVRQRLKSVEARLLYSDANLKAIADEFGFTDESYLCKLFRKYYGLSPGEFRNNR